MTFMVVDTDSYDVLLGLDLLIKIGAIVDIEQGLIQVRRGPGVDVEVLPLTMEEITDDEDYADWIQWAVEEEQRMQSLSEATIAAEESVLL
ncbi:unnamed protein product [Sphagnum troendelagicum]